MRIKDEDKDKDDRLVRDREFGCCDRSGLPRCQDNRIGDPRADQEQELRRPCDHVYPRGSNK